jgi:transcriptional regulator with XRE-family HTH domain
MRRANLRSDDAAAWRKQFGDRVRELRQRIELSQEQLAEAAQVHRTYVGSVERGEQNISLVLIHMVANALQVEPAELFREVGRRPRASEPRTSASLSTS